MLRSACLILTVCTIPPAVAHAAAAAPAPAPQDRMAKAQPWVGAAEYALTLQTATSMTDSGAGWQAPNRAHGFLTQFTETGIRVGPRIDAGRRWTWGLRLVRAGRPDKLESVSKATLRVERNRIEYARGELTEWYVNDPRGLEQGFTFSSAPGRGRGDVVIDLALESTLFPTFSGDGQAVDFRAADGSGVLRYAELIVTDARGQRLPARMEGMAEPELSGIRLVFDDREAVYPVTVDPLSSSWTWSASGHQASAFFGYSVATAGDVNGDGFSDVIIGSYPYDNGQADEGRVFVYLGSPSGLATTAAWTSEGDQPNANYGLAVASAGDVNGDGFDDVIIGAIGYPVSASRTGKAFVFHGSASGLSPSAAWSATSDGTGTLFGYSVASAGDVNGDGYADAIVSDISGAGRVYVYLGSASGLSPTAAWTKNGTQTALGHSVATAGDVNGDGYADVIIGAAGESNDQTGEGRAYVYLGSSSGLASTPVWTREGDSVNAAFGISVATAGDVNGDGYADVIVGAYTEGGTTENGRASVYLGSASGPSTVAHLTVNGGSNDRLGTCVATAGDINGDGYADVLVGASRNDGFSGSARLYLGSNAGLSSDFGIPIVGPNGPSDRFGSSVETAGDVNGDGYSDVVVGAYGYNDEQSLSGAAFLYFGSAAAAVTNPAWTAESDTAYARFGHSVATAGDVNGDGYADAIVGAPDYGNGETAEGRAFLYLGSAAGLAATPSWTATSNQVNSAFGSSVATAGDVNGDGYSDVIVGAPDYSNDETGEGRAFLYLGSAAGLAATPSWTAESNQGGARFGTSVASAGDVNGDGYSDVIVGADRFTNGQNQEGRAYLYLGSATGLAAMSSWTTESDTVDARFGHSVATAGDVNGDGHSDVIVGAPRYTNPQSEEGAAFLYFGSAAGLPPTPSWTVEGGQAVAQLGWSVATAGDVTGDGYSDVIVGAPVASSTLCSGCGRAFLYRGSAAGLATTPLSTLDGFFSNENFGLSVAAAGDVNGDGYSDVIVGSPYYSYIQANEGRAQVYLGSPTGLGSMPAWWTEINQTYASFGQSVAPAGDVNGDGYPDVLVGADGYMNGQFQEGRSYLYLGNGGAGRERTPGQARTDGSIPLALLAKSDSETGFRVRTLGLTPAGRGKLRLQWEVKPLGQPFNRTNMGSSSVVMTSSPGSSGSAFNFNELIAGLNEGAFYHWRIRTISADPLFPRSPWFSIAGNGITETKLRTAGCLDSDGDGYGALSDPSCGSLLPDCSDSNNTVWSTPGETVNLRFSSKTTLNWDPPPIPGGQTSALRYDTLRAVSPGSFQSAACVETDDGPNTTAMDSAKPSTGQAYYYLARAENSCPQGSGSLGASSDGVPRAGTACP